MQLKINFQNCYGIKKLEHEFEFSEENKTFSIYASNGTMKTSFAKIFDDISKGEKPKDLIFTSRNTACQIDVASQPIDKKSIFVIPSYDKDYQSDKKYLLLANKELRKEYEDIYKDIEQSKEIFLKALKKVCGVKVEEIENNISKIFSNGQENKFFESLKRVENEVNSGKVKQYKNVKYKDVFQDATKELLMKDDVRSNIEVYINKYDALLEQSTYFKKGIFNHSQAEEVAKQLKNNGFFEIKKHAILFDNEKIIDEKRLTEIIKEEKNKILTDDSLQETFAKLDVLLRGNEKSRNLREFLLNNQFIIAELNNLDSFEDELWKYYLSEYKENFNELLNKYNDSEVKIKEIFQKATDEKDDWTVAIKIFNERFLVPFKVIINNKAEVMLKEHPPIIGFEFVEESDKKIIEKGNLLAVLSQGEKRALYLLDIIFEIEARKKEGGLHLFIIDDIADSFDYKNKYAIIEYLKDISETEGFFQIVLSHNYDFHRTIASRLSMKRSNKLEVKKSQGEVIFSEEKYQNSVFKDWRDNLNDSYKFIASIGLVRNLAEYSGNDSVFNDLTLCLHMKDDTKGLKIKFIKGLFRNMLPAEAVDKISNDEMYFLKLLENSIASMPSDVELEHKIVLAISIRLESEKFMIKKINDQNFVKSIEKNQTQTLLSRFKKNFPDDVESIKILNKVQLMTPESIHINSFMFEPLLDMAHEYLIKLNTEIKELNRIS